MAVSVNAELLARLVRGEHLTRGEASEALAEVLRGEVDATLIASFLTALALRGETPDEMTGFIDAMVAAGETFTVVPGAMDIVGTGGDRMYSVNVSTMTALTIAGLGIPVAKHGNRAASSSVGTADVLEGLGVKIDVDGSVVAACVAEAGMGFCFAPRFHSGLRHLGPIRKALAFPTAFNVLGPMANPAGVRRLLIGVANPAMMDRMAEVLRARNIERAALIHSHDGLDELSLGSPATLYSVVDGEVSTEVIDAGATLGVRHDAASIRGGDLATNVRAVEEYLAATPGPVFDVVTANAALALQVAGRTSSLEEGFELARNSVRQGEAASVLDKLRTVSNR
ncbi:MAG: anthranilate phosphoribosyltransferase [Actinobacteria bacterium]|nr:anthranilate phosphoribosyltransferase [Actinomycetota bacterium]